VTSDATRLSRRRPVELVAMCMDRRGKEGLHVAVTISTLARGMHREVFHCGPTPAGLVSAIRRIADWIEREHAPKIVGENTGAYKAFVKQQFGTMEEV
jgi:hypothetical protein